MERPSERGSNPYFSRMAPEKRYYRLAFRKAVQFVKQRRVMASYGGRPKWRDYWRLREVLPTMKHLSYEAWKALCVEHRGFVLPGPSGAHKGENA